MHPAFDPNTAQSLSLPAMVDPTFITHALLHSLGMGILLMGVTAWIDAKQLKGASMQSNIQNSSNVLFMCVAIATVIILVGNNIARAFALGAAIALIRFKMKLGESSSGSGLLFAILCGMSSAIGLHQVGWTLALGYSIVQIILNRVIQRFPAEVPMGVPAVASDPQPEVPPVEVTQMFNAQTKDPRGKVMKVRALLTLIGVIPFAGLNADAAECTGRYQDSVLKMKGDHVFNSVSIINGGRPLYAGKCKFAEQPEFVDPFAPGEKYSISCEKSNGAYFEDEWEKSLVGVRFKLTRRGLRVDRIPTDMLVTQSVMGSLAVHIGFHLPNFEFASIVDLLPSPNGQWNLEWEIESREAKATQTVSCEIRKL